MPDQNYREHKVAALIGPNGEIELDWYAEQEMDWDALYESSMNLGGLSRDELRRAVVTIRVPVLGPRKPVELEADCAPVSTANNIFDAEVSDAT